MALQHVIKDVVDKFGVEVIRDSRLVNILDDMRAFTDAPAAKSVLKEILRLGFGEKLYTMYETKEPSWELKINSYAYTIVNQHGFREDITSQLLDAISWAIKPEMSADGSTQATQEKQTPNTPADNSRKVSNDISKPTVSTNLSTKATEAELKSCITDEYGAKYSQDGLKLFSGPKDLYKSYEVKDGTIVICDHAFAECRSLTSIEIPSSVTTICDFAFWECTSLTSITLPSGVTSIGDFAFCDCKLLSSIVIPSSVTSIGNSAFMSCRALSSIVIPNSVTSIGMGAFGGCVCKLTCNSPHFKVHDNALYTADMRTIISCATSKNSFVIPSGVTSIGDSAFWGCESLISIVIPSGVTSIGEAAFSGCYSLTSVTLPEGVTSIGNWAFSRCKSLTNIEIPSSITRIGDRPFGGCKSLKAIYIPAGSYYKFEMMLPFNYKIRLEEKGTSSHGSPHKGLLRKIFGLFEG